MGHVLVVGDIALPPPSILKPLVRGADLVVAADGGANRALEAGVKVDWVVGDLDGILPDVLARFPKSRIRRDANPYRTDLEKVMGFLSRRKGRRVVLTGVTGGRLDHTLGTLAVLAAWRGRFTLRVVDEHFVTTLVERSATFRAAKGTMVSLMAPAGARGVTTRGLRFALQDRDLDFSPLGIHNEVAHNPVRITVREGLLYLMRSHGVKPHA